MLATPKVNMLDSGFMPLVIWEVTKISKVLDVLLLLGRKQQSFVHRTIVLFTLHTICNAIMRLMGICRRGYAQQDVPIGPKGLRVRPKDGDWTTKEGKAQRLATRSPRA